MGQRDTNEIPLAGSRPRPSATPSPVSTQPHTIEGNCFVVDGQKFEIPIGFPRLREEPRNDPA